MIRDNSMPSTLDNQIAKIQKQLAAKKTKEKKASNPNAEAVGRCLANNTVTRSHSLSRAYYRFTIGEKRIMEALVSRLHPMRNDNELQDIELSATDYAKTYSVAKNHAYGDLATAAKGLMGKIITSNEPPYIVDTTLMIQSKYHENEGRIVCTLNPLIVPQLIGIRGKFNSYPLVRALDFKSSYTWRMYELLVSWAQPKKDVGGVFCGWFEVETTELRKMLGVPDSYNQGRFTKAVIEHVINELNQKADIRLKLEPKKTSRRITSYRVTFAENEQQQLPLEGGVES